MHDKLPEHSRAPNDGMITSLRTNQLFVGMSEQAVTAAITRALAIDLISGAEIVLEGSSSAEQSGGIYLIAAGSVRIARSVEDSEDEMIAQLGPSEFFGEMSIPRGELTSAKVIAIENCKLFILERSVFEELCTAEPMQVLENVIRALGSRLRNMNDAVVDLRVRQSKLAVIGSVVQQIAHDLKSPLNIVLGVADLLDEGAENKKSSTMLRRASQAILGLVEDILAFASDKPRRPHEWFPLSELVADVEDFGLGSVERKGRIQVQRDYQYEGLIFGDRVELQRALLNLIKNAEEAMPVGGTLSVSTSRVGEKIQFRVRDTGGGIPEVVKQRLFSPFVTAGKSGGSGLGLSMVKRAVTHHQGTVSVKSGTGGTEFVLEINQGPYE